MVRRVIGMATVALAVGVMTGPVRAQTPERSDCAAAMFAAAEILGGARADTARMYGRAIIDQGTVHAVAEMAGDELYADAETVGRARAQAIRAGGSLQAGIAALERDIEACRPMMDAAVVRLPTGPADGGTAPAPAANREVIPR